MLTNATRTVERKRQNQEGQEAPTPASLMMPSAISALPHRAAPGEHGHAFGAMPILPSPAAVVQRKMDVSQPGDAGEIEADRVADEVMRMEDPSAGETALEREAVSLGRGSAQRVARASTGDGQDEAIDVARTVESGLTGGGSPLDSAARSYLEPRFGHDFSQVRVHTDSRAAASAMAISARAYAVGRDVVFGAGEYSPGSSQGRRLLAHELTHVVQQGGGSAGGAGGASSARRISTSSLKVQRALSTLGGEWDTVTYDPVNEGGKDCGVKIDMKFTPKPPVDAKAISMSQMVNSLNEGKPIALNPTVESRSIPKGEAAAGSHIDQFAKLNSPVYAQTPGTPNAPSLAGSTIGAQWGANGFHYKDATGALLKQDAELRDTPKLPNRGANASQIFETTALAVDGTQTGTYYGSVRWGWQTDGDGNFTKLPFSVISAGVPSPTFMSAAELWNAGKTSDGSDTLDLPTSKVISGDVAPSARSTSNIVLRIAQLDTELPKAAGVDKTNLEFERAALDTELKKRGDQPTTTVAAEEAKAAAMKTADLIARDKVIDGLITASAAGTPERTNLELERAAVRNEQARRDVKITVHVTSTDDWFGSDEVYVKMSGGAAPAKSDPRDINDGHEYTFTLPLATLVPLTGTSIRVEAWDQDWPDSDDMMLAIDWPAPFSKASAASGKYAVSVEFDK